MSAVGLESIEHTVHVTHTWITELDQWLGWNNKPAVLSTARDWLPVNEVADFAASSRRRVRQRIERPPPLKAPQGVDLNHSSGSLDA